MRYIPGEGTFLLEIRSKRTPTKDANLLHEYTALFRAEYDDTPGLSGESCRDSGADRLVLFHSTGPTPIEVIAR